MTDEKTLRSISIDTLKLSVRAQNVLHRAGKHTLFELLPCTEEELRAYIATGEPMDKAGAYGVQSLGALLVERIDGDFYNVMGLPVEKLGQCLTKHFGVRFF